jgi:hypothetical protein
VTRDPMSDPGGKWLAGYAIALGVAALLAISQTCCTAKPAACPVPPAPRTVTVAVSCLRLAPPPHPELAGDKAIDAARLADAYDRLRLWALHAWAVCAE